MQPTEESLKIAGTVVDKQFGAEKNPATQVLWLKYQRQQLIDAFALALDAAYQRGKDHAQRLDEPFVDDTGESWFAPTAWGYYQACKVLRDIEDERDELSKKIGQLESELLSLKSNESLSPNSVADSGVQPSGNPGELKIQPPEILAPVIDPCEVADNDPNLDRIVDSATFQRERQPERATIVEASSLKRDRAQLDSALALAAQRGEIIRWVEEALSVGLVKHYSPLTEIKLLIREHKSQNPTPEAWLSEKLKRAKAEVRIEYLQAAIDTGDHDVLTRHGIKMQIAAIRKEAGL